MAGRKPSEAVTNFLDPLQRAASCVTESVFRPTASGYREGTGHALILNKGEPVRLRGRATLRLSAQLEYDVVKLTSPPQEAIGPWKVATRAYSYHVMTEDMTEVILWHWHPARPGGYTDPHFHIGKTQLAPEALATMARHSPTGRIAFEQVLLQLLTDYGVRPRREDWQACLNETLERFARWRTWHSSPGEPGRPSA